MLRLSPNRPTDQGRVARQLENRMKELVSLRELSFTGELRFSVSVVMPKLESLSCEVVDNLKAPQLRTLKVREVPGCRKDLDTLLAFSSLTDLVISHYISPESTLARALKVGYFPKLTALEVGMTDAQHPSTSDVARELTLHPRPKLRKLALSVVSKGAHDLLRVHPALEHAKFTAQSRNDSLLRRDPTFVLPAKAAGLRSLSIYTASFVASHSLSPP